MKKHYSIIAFGAIFLLLSGAGCLSDKAPQESEETASEEQDNAAAVEATQLSQDMLRDDLMNRPDLIPYEGVLGGTMRVYAPDAIYFIDDGLVVASFEDGHVAGTMTLRYTIAQDGSVDWQVISSECDGCTAK